MRYRWEFDEQDVRQVQAFVARWSKSPLVTERIRRNLSSTKQPVTRERFWLKLVACLLTSQQRSGPNDPVTRFLRVNPFPLRVSVCDQQKGVAVYCSQVLREFGGIRFTSRIPEFVHQNLPLLTGSGWTVCRVVLDRLCQDGGIKQERSAANFIEDRFVGFGPKQARNLLQMLGLTRYEVPIDSRVARWLRDFGFPVPLSAASLNDRAYYEFVEDGLQTLCQACGIVPCVLDAAVFASFDGDEWTDEIAFW